MDCRISEIFFSLQGESNTVGWPTVFVRLTGCPLRCQYCDTAYAFSGGEKYSLDRVLEEVKQYSAKYITISGGEPLVQPSVYPLMEALCDQGYQVSIETCGAFDIGKIDPRVMVVMDIKTPGSQEVERNLYANIELLKPTDQVKFVICDRTDFEWACDKVNFYDLTGKCTVLFSPSYEEVPHTTLADWILESGLNIRFQFQLHKMLWGDKPGV